MTKKLISLILLIIIIFTGCSNKLVAENNNNNSAIAANKISDTKTIPFKYTFTGFVLVNDINNDLPVGAHVFRTQEEWTQFKDKYLTDESIPYPGYSGGIDFTKECVVYYSMLDAKANFYAKAWKIDSITLVNQQINIVLKDISSNLTITATNSEKFGGQRYVIVVTVNKNDLPSAK